MWNWWIDCAPGCVMSSLCIVRTVKSCTLFDMVNVWRSLKFDVNSYLQGKYYSKSLFQNNITYYAGLIFHWRQGFFDCLVVSYMTESAMLLLQLVLLLNAVRTHPRTRIYHRKQPSSICMVSLRMVRNNRYVAWISGPLKQSSVAAASSI